MKSLPYRIAALTLFIISNVTTISALEVGDLAPDVSATDLDGKVHRLQDYRGKWIFLDIWASWCGPCQEELPHIQQAYTDHQSDQFVVIGISIDANEQAWREAINHFGLKYILLHSKGAFASPVTKAFGVRGIPSTWVIDPDGKIVMKDVRGEAAVTQTIAALSKGDQETINKLTQENEAFGKIIAAYKDFNDGKLQESEFAALMAVYLRNYPHSTNAATIEPFLLEMGYDQDGKPLPKIEVGKEIPNIEFTTPAGKNRSLKELRNKWVLLSFWASWDDKHQEFLETLGQLDETQAPHKGTVLAINTDDDDSIWEAFVQANQELKVPCGHPAGAKVHQLYKQFDLMDVAGFLNLPASFLIDPKGILVARNIPKDKVEAFLKAFTQGSKDEQQKMLDSLTDPKVIEQEFLKIDRMAAQIKTGQTTQEEFEKAAQEFIAKYPDSSYADYVRSALPDEE